LDPARWSATAPCEKFEAHHIHAGAHDVGQHRRIVRAGPRSRRFLVRRSRHHAARFSRISTAEVLASTNSMECAAARRYVGNTILDPVFSMAASVSPPRPAKMPCCAQSPCEGAGPFGELLELDTAYRAVPENRNPPRQMSALIASPNPADIGIISSSDTAPICFTSASASRELLGDHHVGGAWYDDAAFARLLEQAPADIQHGGFI